MPERVHKRLAGADEPASKLKRHAAGNLNGSISLDVRGKKRKHDDFRDTTKTSLEHPDLPPSDSPKQGYLSDQKPSSSPGNQKNPPSARVDRPKPPYINGARTTASPHTTLKSKALALEPLRKTLPVWSDAPQIRTALRSQNILLLSGETGSGKSTQIPQILASEPWCRPRTICLPSSPKDRVKVGGCIAITEPRRVAAISLARRVAEEMGSPLGSASPNSTVGYSVRFDNSTSACTRVKFLTEGMLLREMVRDPGLRAYSAVVVDEVHERGVNVDLVLGFLKGLVCGEGVGEGRGGVPLKVVVMSATAEMERLVEFLGEGVGGKVELDDRGVVDGGGKIVNGGDQDADGVGSGSEWSGISLSDEDGGSGKHKTNGTSTANSTKKKTGKSPSGVNSPNTEIHDPPDPPPIAPKPTTKTSLRPPNLSTLTITGRQHPVTIQHTPTPVTDIIDAALRTIFQIHQTEPMPGDILVFLTGQETVETLQALVLDYSANLPPHLPKMLVLPLFAALPQSAQQAVFQPPPPKTRKVILATNIAETSITVPGVRFVIDSGKAKQKQYRAKIGLESLLVKPISQSAALQRQGRAGREAPGKCWRLYTEESFLQMERFNTPEILRCDLAYAILTMKARGVRDVFGFPFLDPPPREVVERALLGLYQLGALDDSGGVSEVGVEMAKLPLSVELGRVLLAASEAEFDCVGEAIDVIACLSVENVFLNLSSEEKKEEAEVARRELFRREGDHLTLLMTVRGFAAENGDRKGWAERHFVSHRAMRAVMDVRKQLRALCQRAKRLDVTKEDEKGAATTMTVTPEKATAILKCFLKGFAMNTARLFPDGSFRTVVGNQSVAIHPSSGLFGKKVEAIMYNEFVFTNRSYARGVSAVQMDWIGEALGA